MAVKRLARWSLSITMLFAVVPAVAQTNSSTAGAGGGGKFRAACGEDLQRFCASVQPGGGRLVQCLSSHTSELSAACGNMIAAAGRGGAKIRAACDQDLQRYCVGVQPGRGRLIQCLSSRTSELSTACGNMIAAIQARKGTSDASAQSPATQPAAPATIGHSRVTIGTILRASCGPDVQRLCAGARRESEVLKCLELSAPGTIDNLQHVFPELGRAADRPGECSEQKAAVTAINHTNPGPRECSEQKAAAIGTHHANPGPGECSEQNAVTATNHANPGPGECSEQKAAVTATNHSNTRLTCKGPKHSA